MGGEVANVIVQNSFNPFWENVINYYQQLSNYSLAQNASEFISDFIHFNKNILIDSKVVYIKEWVDKDILKIKDLTKDCNNEFLNYQEFQIKYNTHTNFLTYYGIINAIKNYQTKRNIELTEQTVKFDEQKTWKIIVKGNLAIRTAIQIREQKHNAINKWNIQFQNLNWDEIFSNIHKNTLDTKLIWFEYKIIYRIIPTNRHLSILKIKDNSLCNFCNTFEQTILHLFLHCEHVISFWNALQNLIRETCTHCNNFAFSEEMILFGRKEQSQIDQILYMIILIAKYFIFMCKIDNKEPRLQQFRPFLKYRLLIEKKSQTQNKQQQFDQTYILYQNLLL